MPEIVFKLKQAMSNGRYRKWREGQSQNTPRDYDGNGKGDYRLLDLKAGLGLGLEVRTHLDLLSLLVLSSSQ